MNVFITGGTGYLGGRLIPALIKRNHSTRALVRKGSENKLPSQCTIIYGNALDASTFKNELTGIDTVIHMVGVAHPSPKMKEQFQTIDLASITATVEAIKSQDKKPHLVYLSVAQIPTEIMKDYQAVRAQGELLITSDCEKTCLQHLPYMFFKAVLRIYISGSKYKNKTPCT